MVNRLHALIYRPEKGWDPVPVEYARRYAEHEWQKVDESLVDRIAQWIGGIEGKHVLDLGGGPGQYSVAFAKRGALVTWYDVSRNYLQIAQEKAKQMGVSIEFCLGYVDEAPGVLNRQFDLVFNRICFCYGWSDASFAHTIYQLIRPGGYGYIEANNSSYHRTQLNLLTRFLVFLNEKTAIKIGHPHPPRGRIARLMLGYPIKQLYVDYSEPHLDRVLVQKAEDKP